MTNRHISLLTAIFLIHGTIYADELTQDKEPEKIEIVATSIDATKTTAKASDDVLVYYGSTILRSDRAFFDKNSSLLTLDGNIDSIGYEQTKEQSDHMVINTKTKAINFDKLFLANDSDIWLYTDDAVKNEEIYTLGNTIASSCSVKNPLWKMVFNNSSYDKNDNYMKVYGAKLYMWDVPVMYLPYIAFNTKKERRSGILLPKLGYGQNDGFMYEQPLFFALSDSLDIELNPQLRTNRSTGLYGSLRFADTEYSHGELRTGIFHDFESYQISKNNKYQDHYGLEFIYDSSRLFGSLPFGLKDGLYINTIYLNDIDYVNLQKSKFGHFRSGYFQESRINYFQSNNDYYGGINAKYFIDTTKISNDETMQILPSLNFHKFYAPFIDSLPVNYSLDIKTTNYYRPTGSKFRQARLLLPIEYNTNLWNDYLKITLVEELYAEKLFFDNTINNDSEFFYIAPLQTIKLYSDLTKRYDGGIHVIQPYLKYIYPSAVYTGDTIYDNLGADTKELFKVDLAKERLEIGGSQYLYNSDTNVKFYQRFIQPYYTKANYKWGDLSHDIGATYDKFEFSNRILYSHEFGKLRSSYTGISWSEDIYSATLSHSYNVNFVDDIIVTPLANNISVDASYKSSPLMRWYGGISYNLNDNLSSAWRVGGDYETECFGLNIYLSKNTLPSLSTTGVSFESSTAIYFQINFKPFASTGTIR